MPALLHTTLEPLHGPLHALVGASMLPNSLHCSWARHECCTLPSTSALMSVHVGPSAPGRYVNVRCCWQEEMAQFRDLEYCKVDLIAAKGIIFCKYAKSSSALLALEAIMANGNMVRARMHPRNLPSPSSCMQVLAAAHGGLLHNVIEAHRLPSPSSCMQTGCSIQKSIALL